MKNPSDTVWKAMRLCGCTDCSGTGQYDLPRACNRAAAIAKALTAIAEERDRAIEAAKHWKKETLYYAAIVAKEAKP